MTFSFVLFLATSVLGAVVIEKPNTCSINEFACSDGACVSQDRVCDGIKDCSDGSDERVCLLYSDPFKMPSIREKRQSACGKRQWRCRDGTCVRFDMKCDGAVDCPDGSDESHATCRNTLCQSNLFRCTYGACVDGIAPCNGIQECADNSDELQPQCRKDSDDVGGKFKCLDGTQISVGDKCDGVPHCPDGSDETVRACASVRCAGYLFQCAYGACTDAGSDCDGKQDCADGSDEAPDLCNRIGPGPTVKPPTSTKSPVTQSPNAKCTLPAPPEHGSYTSNYPQGRPGEKYDFLTLNYTCQPGYGVSGAGQLYCFDGVWQYDLPQCVRLCKLNIKNPAVEYHCRIPNTQGGYRPCGPYEPVGTIIDPKCQSPNYYSPTALPTMRCVNGDWDYSANCLPECGTLTPEGEQLIFGGTSAKHGELPWHVGIYSKAFKPYKQICGGSIVSTTLVLSAAHCFWDDSTKKQPASSYAVAAGKIYRPWDESHDADAQKSDVSDIKIPDRFYGSERNFADDIALVFLSTPLQYKPYIRPVCLSYDEVFENTQLADGNLGKVAGWGLISANGPASQVLKTVELPYVNIRTCLARAPTGYREHITGDKFCAGFEKGPSLCKGDSGGGLVFPSTELGVVRYYLRGIVSTAPRNFDQCNTNAVTSFTQISKFYAFIREWQTA